MYFRTAAANTGAAFFNPVRRRLTTPTPTPILSRSNRPQNPEAAAEDAKKLVLSVLSSPDFNHQVWRKLLSRFNPHEFDSIFCDIHRNVNHSTSMRFFHFAFVSFGYKFTLRSYCLLFHLLVLKNVDSKARMILMRLIYRRVPVCEGERVDAREIACTIVDTCLNFQEFKSTNNRVFDILVNTYATVPVDKKLSLGIIALDVFKMLANGGLFPSTKTCVVLMSSLIKADQAEKGYEVFEIVSKVFLPNLAMFNSAITALFRLGKVEKAVNLFKKMEGLGASVAPDVYTCTILIDGFCRNGLMDSAFEFKDKMVANGLIPDMVTYSVIIKELMKIGKCDEAIGVVNEIVEKGIVPEADVYNNLIDVYCMMKSMTAATNLKNLMLQKEIPVTVFSYNLLIRSYSSLGRVHLTKTLLEEMASRNIPLDKNADSWLIHGYSKSCRMEEAYEVLSKKIKKL